MKKARIDEILSPGDQEEEARREQRVRTRFWVKVRRTAGRIPFMEDVVAAYYCALDPETPTRVRGILFAALAYFILPLDSLPDFIAGFGLTDDIAVLTAAISAIREHLKESHRIAARNALEKPKEDVVADG